MNRDSQLEARILERLSERARYGHELLHDLREETPGLFENNEGALYPILHTLVAKRRLRACWDDLSDGTLRKFYGTARRPGASPATEPAALHVANRSRMKRRRVTQWLTRLTLVPLAVLIPIFVDIDNKEEINNMRGTVGRTSILSETRNTVHYFVRRRRWRTFGPLVMKPTMVA